MHGNPRLRGNDRPPSAADPGSRTGPHHGPPLLHAGDPRRVPGAADRPAFVVVAGRHLRRRTVDRGDARRASPAARGPARTSATWSSWRGRTRPGGSAGRTANSPGPATTTPKLPPA